MRKMLHPERYGFADYAAALRDCGRTEKQIEDSVARNKSWYPVLEIIHEDGRRVVINENALRPAAFKTALKLNLDAAIPKAPKAKRAEKCCPHCGGKL